MGMEFGLYDHEAKEFIWLGKTRVDGHGQFSYQLDNAAIVHFLATHGDVLHIYDDGGAPPDWTEEGWTKLDDWCKDRDDDF